MIGRILGRRGGPPREAAKIDPAASAFLHLARDGAVAEDGPSPARRAVGLVLALMVLAAMPLYWVSGASGDTGKQPLAVKSSNSGSGEEDDEDGDGDEGDDPSATGTATSHRGDGTQGTTNNTGVSLAG